MKAAKSPAISHLELREGIIRTCVEINRIGLNQGTSGNVSHRTEDGILITPTSLPYDMMKPEDIVDLSWDASYEGRHRPSSEWRFHRDIQKNRPDINVVLHTHSIYCTTLAVHEKPINSFHYMVAVAGGIDIRCAPYACFGTQELSDHALEALEDRTACLLGHHGLIVLADTFEKAIWRAVEVETLAKMYVHALAIGEPPALSRAEMERVIEQMRLMSYGQMPDVSGVTDTPRLKGEKGTSAKAAGKASGKAKSVNAKAAAKTAKSATKSAAAPKAAVTKAEKKSAPKAAAKAAKSAGRSRKGS
jgi:L-fuculose-phosphate aldolase